MLKRLLKPVKIGKLLTQKTVKLPEEEYRLRPIWRPYSLSSAEEATERPNSSNQAYFMRSSRF